MTVRVRSALPVPLPRAGDATVLGSSGDTARVVVGPVVFVFERVDNAWVGDGAATTSSAGLPLDERYLTVARAVAFDALSRAGRGEDALPETLRCPECGRVLASPELASMHARSAVNEVECGPVHIIRFANRYALAIGPDEATWEPRG